jgi:hypothetical protein
MIRPTRLMPLALLVAVSWFATPGAAVDLDTLMQEFRVTPAARQPAPAFGLPTLEGRTTTLAEHRGRAVLLYFWATW